MKQEAMTDVEYAGTRAAPEKGFTIRWATPNVGFGQFYFWHDGEKVQIASEHMGKEFIKKVLCKMVDDAEIWDKPQ